MLPWLDVEDLIDAGPYDFAASDDQWLEIESWLLSLEQSEALLLWLIERCLDYGELLPDELIEARLKDCSQNWISACLSAIKAAPEEFAREVLGAVSMAMRVERNK